MPWNATFHTHDALTISRPATAPPLTTEAASEARSLLQQRLVASSLLSAIQAAKSERDTIRAKREAHLASVAAGKAKRGKLSTDAAKERDPVLRARLEAELSSIDAQADQVDAPDRPEALANDKIGTARQALRNSPVALGVAREVARSLQLAAEAELQALSDQLIRDNGPLLDHISAVQADLEVLRSSYGADTVLNILSKAF